MAPPTCRRREPGQVRYTPAMSLERQVASPTSPSWMRRHAAGLTCYAIGLLAVAVTALVHFEDRSSFTKIPDVRLTAPFLILALAAAITTFVRREGAYALAVIGVALAAAALALGWVLVLAAVGCAAAIAVLILSEML